MTSPTTRDAVNAGARLDPLVGRELGGRYVIERLVGSGAMASVYRAGLRATGEPVAIKVMHPELKIHPTFVARFHREARATARLDHPNSVRVLDFGEEPDGLLYIVMEYVEGRDLHAVMTAGEAMPPERIVDLLGQVLAALEVAHDMGVLHRDLKPANVLVIGGAGEDGRPIERVKVCDFGIAKLLDAFGDGSGEGQGLVSTMGVVCGTPHYMSPEQATGEKLDARSDLYGIGVVLFQLLTGRMPFEGSAVDVLHKHLGEEPANPCDLVPSAHPGIAAVCRRALRKRPDERYASASEMRSALQGAIGAAEGRASAPSSPRELSPRA